MNIKFILILFLVWRVLLFIPLFAGPFFIPYREGSDYTNIWKFTKPYPPVDNPLIYPWANFDGVHFLEIAGDGYRDNERFFPLYPILIKLLSGNAPAFSAIQFFIALAISNLAFLTALILLYKLLKLDYENNVAITTIIAILLFPTSFFFASSYSESLFLLFAVAGFYFARRSNWLLVSIFSSLLILTRLVGIFALPVFLLEKKSRFLILPAVAFLLFCVFNFYSFGNPFQFLLNQQELANSRSLFVFPLQTVFRYLNILISLPKTQFEWFIALLELATFFFICSALFISFKKNIRASYILFSLLTVLPAIFSGTFSGLPRYLLVSFPLFIALALVKNKTARLAYIIISPILLFLLLMFFSRGYFIA